jgi:phosphatidate cytidylyltransferase
MNNLLVRAISGLVFITIVIGSILWNDAAYMEYVFGLFSGLALYEFSQLVSVKNISLSKPVFIGAGILIFALFSPSLVISLQGKLALFFVLLIIVWAIEIWRKQENALQTVVYSTFGLMYCTLPFVAMIWVNSLGVELEMARDSLLYMLIVVWTNDTFAYLTGRLLGKHKLFERISPKKTWEGTIGGIVMSMVAGLLIAAYTYTYPWSMWLIGALLIAIGAIVGDLFESLIKRNLGVKDSGNSIPGHGGVLDRFDAAMFAAPIFIVWFYLYGLIL